MKMGLTTICVPIGKRILFSFRYPYCKSEMFIGFFNINKAEVPVVSIQEQLANLKLQWKIDIIFFCSAIK